MGFFTKKPVQIEAQLWDGTVDGAGPIIDWIVAGQGSAAYRDHDPDPMALPRATIAIDTLEGTVVASPGDWVIKGVAGEFYPCKPDIFAATYAAVA
jgi:hypothetical protein